MATAFNPARERKKTPRVRAASLVSTQSLAKTEEFSESQSRFERKFREIVVHATDVFYEKGYEGASMRDLSRASGMSLAGLYHYFESKEKLLYLIQRHTFQTVIERLRERLVDVSDPEERLRVFIENHLEYFLANMKAMKVLSHEDDVLGSNYGEEIQAIKREYYELCRELLEKLDVGGMADPITNRSRLAKTGSRDADANERANLLRLDVLSLFGMMNWIYTWYTPRMDGDAARLARRMGDVFLSGVLNSRSENRT